jgi:hypothetical protein
MGTPYGFTEWNNPLAQRELWKIPPYYEWQEYVIRYMMKNLHSHMIISGPNEMGKTRLMLPGIGLAVMAAFPGAQVYSTAGSEAQIKGQLFEYLEQYVRPYRKQGWEINKTALELEGPKVQGLQSRWFGRVPRDALTAEGFHEGYGIGDDGKERFCPLLMFIDEGKSVTQDVFDMVMRLRPTWIITLSTPDEDTGPYYKAMGPEEVLKQGRDMGGYIVLEDERRYWGLRMMVSDMACPHLRTPAKVKEAEQVREHSGENSRLYRSMVKGLFTAGDQVDRVYHGRDVAKVVDAMCRAPWEGCDRGKAMAGMDLSMTGGGDPKKLYICKGSRILPVFVTREDDTTIVAKWAVDLLRQYGVAPQDCRVDNGGGGKAIVDMMESYHGYWGIDRYMNNATPLYGAEYYDRITEDTFGVMQLFHEHEFTMAENPELLDDMRSRQKIVLDRKTKLQKKKDHRKLYGKSPDDLDTLTMCLSGLLIPGVRAYLPKRVPPPAQYDEKQREKHYPERKRQDENLKRMGGWGLKARSMSEIMKGMKR